MTDPLEQISAVLKHAEYLHGLYLSELHLSSAMAHPTQASVAQLSMQESTRLDAETNEKMTQAEQRLKKLEKEVTEFSSSLNFLADPQFQATLEKEQLKDQAQDLVKKINSINQSLLEALTREQDHLASEIRQQFHSSKALDAYRR